MLISPPLLCFFLQAAGGVSHNGHGSMLDLRIDDTGMRSVIAVGSAAQVQQCVAALQAGGASYGGDDGSIPRESGSKTVCG